MDIRKVFLYLLITSVAISALVGIAVLLFGNFGHVEIRILMSTLTVTAASIGGLACGAYYETGRGRILPLAGVVLAITAAILTFFIIWNVGDESETFLKITGNVTLLALACAHLSLLFLARLDRRFILTRTVAQVCVWALTALFMYIIWAEPVGDSDILYRVMGVLGIVLAAVTVVTPVLHKLSSSASDVKKIDAEIDKLRSQIEELERQKAAAAQSSVEA